MLKKRGGGENGGVRVGRAAGGIFRKRGSGGDLSGPKRYTARLPDDDLGMLEGPDRIGEKKNLSLREKKEKGKRAEPKRAGGGIQSLKASAGRGGRNTESGERGQINRARRRERGVKSAEAGLRGEGGGKTRSRID